MTTETIKLMTFGLYRQKNASARTGTLRKGGIEVLKGLGGATVRCTSGTLWVTLQGDPKDYVLSRNETLAIPNLGKVLMSGNGSYRI
jgi:hypothetical protein